MIKIMKCPNCNKNLSFFTANKVTCKHCGSRLVAKNGLAVHFSLILVFALTFKLFIVNTMDTNLILGIFYLAGAALIFQMLRNAFINYKCIDGES